MEMFPDRLNEENAADNYQTDMDINDEILWRYPSIYPSAQDNRDQRDR